MFFIFGVSNGEKKLDYVQTMLCSSCGQFGRLEIYMTYMYFSLFFIPILRWGRKYYVKNSCCNKVYLLDPIVGKRILRGEPVTLSDHDMKEYQQSQTAAGTAAKACSSCGYGVAPDFEFCPKCGKRL